MKKKPSRDILHRLAVTRGRQKAWRDKPELMEAIRRRATAKATAKRHANHAALVARLADLPATLTTEELRAFIAEKYRGVPMSFFNRLRRHGLMLYNADAGVWVNQCRPTFPSGNIQGQDATDGA